MSSRKWNRASYAPLVGVMSIILSMGAMASATVVVRQEIEPGVWAGLRGGQYLFLECRPPKGNAAQAFLKPYLADADSWKIYKGRMAVALQYKQIHPEAKRRMLEALFPTDRVDADGWWHTVALGGDLGTETLGALATWFTGDPTKASAIRNHPSNAGLIEPLDRGQRLLIPHALLLAPLRSFTPVAPPIEPAKPVEFTAKDLAFGDDGKGAYAKYVLKKGEAIYTAVVLRFMDFQSNDDINAACNMVMARSGIRDPRRLEPGQEILIPMDILSDRYRPEGSEGRQAFEAVRREAELLKAQQPRSKDLEDVVVVIDPGHGGRDYGTKPGVSGFYEDEFNYDIAVRLKALLEQNSNARVYMTLKDPSQGWEALNTSRFKHDTDEVVLTTPEYPNYDARISANLRWYLANDIYRKELAKGTDPRKMVFLSLHCDALYYKMRGTMIYVPGAQYRREREQPMGAIYAGYQEAKGHLSVRTTGEQRRMDEALSRNFADTIVQSLRGHDPQIAVSRHGDPIRNVIRRGSTQTFVPAVLRNAIIPTKVLVEVANLNNATDRQRLADAEWRGWYANALLDALKTHFDGPKATTRNQVAARN